MTLSSRISSLTGPDRAVDAEVAVALGWRLHTFNCENINGSTEQGELWIPPYFTEEDVKSAEGEYRSMAAVNAWPESEPPAFTASLDAVASIEEGWTEIECYAPNDEYELFTFYGRDKAGVQHQGLGATECLARLSAALKARGL